ncbi:MAG: tetratricopeptide repeat protein [candidate division Zixibacteria bacterium]|nr:tetratricopeptide repeat protein [candidate division Zixibacteria bacterium]
MLDRYFIQKFLAIIIVISLILGCGQVSNDITFTTKSDKALDIFLDGLSKNENFYNDEARALFGKAVELDPEFAIAYYYWAITSATQDDFQSRLSRAVELIDKASKPERLVILSQKALNDDSSGLALEYLQQLVEVCPNGKRAHLFLGIYYFGQQEWTLSIDEMNVVISLDPNYAPAYNMLGYAYVNTGKYSEAISALKKYSDLRPADPNPHDSMGEIFLIIGDHDNSIKHYTMSLKLESDYVPSNAGLGHNYIFMGDFEKARNAYNDILINASSTADTNTAYFWNAISYIYEGQSEKAIGVLKEQLDHAKILTDIYTQALIHGRMAAIYREMSEFELALQECANMREIAERPDMQPGIKENYDRNYLFTESIVYTRLGKKEMALAKLDLFKISAHASKSNITLKNYLGLEGVLAYWNRDYNVAIKALKDTNPLNQYFKYYLGLCYLKIGEEDEAHEIFNEIVDFNRNGLLYSFVRPIVVKML